MGGKVITFTIYIPLLLEILQTKNGNNWPCYFQEVKNKKLKM